MFKKVMNLLLDIFLVVLFIFFAWIVTKMSVISFYSPGKGIEYLCYITLAFCYLRLFYIVSNLINKSLLKYAAASVISVLFVIQVWLTNSYWIYLNFKSNFHIDLGYHSFLWSNLTYSYGLGEYRYPIAFLLMLILCIGTVIWTSKIKKFLADKWLFCTRKVKKAEAEIENYQYYKDSLTAFYESVPNNTENKGKLITWVRDTNDPFLYELLLKCFGREMTEEEYSTFTEEYTHCFNKDLPD